jgi:2-hydroxychromene-2-carboxylate isomerase
MTPSPSPPPTVNPTASFYFDLSSPLAYLAAEQILHVFPIAAEWQPVLARELEGGETFEAFRRREEEEIFRGEVERRARELGLQALRWPQEFPFDSELAMRVATYAKSIGRVVPFAQAAFRQVFAGGRELSSADNVVIAAAACEMHPAAVLSGAKLRSVERELAISTARATEQGVLDVPAVRVYERVFHGMHAVDQAAAHVREATLAATRR